MYTQMKHGPRRRRPRSNGLVCLHHSKPVIHPQELGATVKTLHVRRLDPWRYQVRSESRRGWYNVSWSKRIWVCDCPFNTKTHRRCKHISAVMSRITGPAESRDDVCPRCETAEHVAGRGNYETRAGLVERYECRGCSEKFTSRTGFRGLQYRANIVTTAIDLHFRGVSLRGIADHLNQQYGFKITHVTVVRWVRKYVAIINRYVNAMKPKVSGTWHVDEMRIKSKGRTRNLWNLMDHKTRYLIAVQVTARKDTREAKRLLSKGMRSVAQSRLQLISDGLPSYSSAVGQINEEQRRVHVTHVADRGFLKRCSNNRLERYNGTVRARLKTMAGFGSDRASRAFAEGFKSYYNCIRRHTKLGVTPSEAARTWRSKEHNRWRSLIRDSENEGVSKPR